MGRYLVLGVDLEDGWQITFSRLAKDEDDLQEAVAEYVEEMFLGGWYFRKAFEQRLEEGGVEAVKNWLVYYVPDWSYNVLTVLDLEQANNIKKVEALKKIDLRKVAEILVSKYAERKNIRKGGGRSRVERNN